MSILVDMTYELVTPESAKYGDAEDRGFEWQDRAHTFRELVRLMDEHREASDSRGIQSGDVDVLLIGQPSNNRDYFEKGHERTTSIHFSRNNAPRAAKYWGKAWRAVQAADARREAALRSMRDNTPC